jgi:hypothetical protein
MKNQGFNPQRSLLPTYYPPLQPLDAQAFAKYFRGMRERVYIETSVVSYYTGRSSRDVVIAGHQQSTQEFWIMLSDRLSPYVSALVLMEASKGDKDMAQKRLDAMSEFPVLQTTTEAERLAQAILDGGGIPSEYPEDALHIAVATTAGMDFIVTWNFAHINNPFTKLMIRQAVENAGYVCPQIVSPDSFLGDAP